MSQRCESFDTCLIVKEVSSYFQSFINNHTVEANVQDPRSKGPNFHLWLVTSYNFKEQFTLYQKEIISNFTYISLSCP